MGEKISIIYDASVICNGAVLNNSRSGIYFTAINILKQLMQHKDIDIVLYCEPGQYFNLCVVLEKEFPNHKFMIITNRLRLLYGYLKLKRVEYRQAKKHIKKLIMQLLLLPCSLFDKLCGTFDYILFRESYKYDAYLSPIYKIPRGVSCKRYTILYDAIPKIFPQFHHTFFDELASSLNGEDYYFAISDATRNDFLKYYPKIKPEHITTTLLACDERFKQSDIAEIKAAKERYNIPSDKKYVFSLCTLEPRKNLIRAVKTFIKFIQKNNIDDMVFVLGGGHWEKFIGILEQEIDNLGDYKDKIIKAGYIDDEDLAPLYSGAEWFVYTSQYEGFGLPPLEAMNCGCPVIASNNSSLPEVVGDAGIMIDYDNDEQHIEAYEQYYYNPELRNEYSKKGLERAAQFSWAKCFNQMFEVIKNNVKGDNNEI